jgi:hypothetical protein
MTSIINNSNANSALVNTINASESKMNPNVYSTKKIYPAAATTYVKTEKTNGAVAVNQVITFDLMKYGICQQLLFCYKKELSQFANIAEYDWVDVIDRIELLSSSKVIDTLTKYDLMAHFSNLDAGQFNLVSKGLLSARTVTDVQWAANKKQLFVVPLVFGFFKDINTNLNLQFNEPMSIRVRFGTRFNGASAGSASIDSNDVYLKVRYKAYNESDFSEILAQNYNEPELSVMSSGYYDENIETTTLSNSGTAAAIFNNGVKGTPVELKNTDCVNDFYVIVRRNDPLADAAAAPHQPIAISRVVMTASGQEIFDLDAEELLYSKLCENGNAILSADGASSSSNIVKIQTGLWEYSGGGTQSNTMSLRELNNPIIRVFFSDSVAKGHDAGQPAATTVQSYEVVVVEDTVKIYSTTSSTGRVQTSLTN